MSVVGSATLELRGDASHFAREMQRASATFKQVNSGLTKSARQFQAFGGQLRSVGMSMTAGITLPLLALGAGASKAAIDFESSFAGIRKTMDLTESEFQRLARANRDLAKTIPVSADELNKIGELAGQLGIQGVRNVLKFEETIAKLAVTTDLTSEQAALSFAQIANILQLPQDQIDRLGAAVVDLGNNFATTESRIVEFTQRIAGAGKIAGLTAGDVSGIGTAFASLGIQAQMGGTAVQKVLIAMLEAANKGGPVLDTFAATAGTSASEFAASFRENAAGAFADFVEGLGRQGDAATVTLEKLGLSNQRLITAFLGAAGAGDLLRRAIETGNTAFEENTALTEEARKRFETTSSQFKILGNRIKDVGITIGNALLPVINKLIDLSGPLIDTIDSMARAFAGLPKFVQLLTVAFAGLVAATPLLLLGIGQVIQTLGSLALIANTAIGAAALGGLGTLLATAGPIVAGGLAAAAAIGGVVAVLTSASREAKKAREELDEFRESLDKPVTIDLVRDFNVDEALAAIKVAEIKEALDDALAVDDVRLAQELRGKLDEAQAELQRFAFRAEQINKLKVETEATVRADISDAEEKLDTLLTRIRQIEDEEVTFEPVLSPRGFVIESASEVRQSKLEDLKSEATETSSLLNQLDADLATFTQSAGETASGAASSATGTVEGLKEALQEISAQVRRVDVRGAVFGFSELEVAEDRVRVLEDALEELVSLDLSPSSAVMQRYAGALNDATTAAALLRDPMGDLIGQFQEIERLSFVLPDFSDIGGRAFAGGTIAGMPDMEKVQGISAPNVNIPDLASLTPGQRQQFIEGVPFDELSGKIKSFGKETKELLFGVGEDMITGLIQGTLDMGDILKRFLLGFAARFILGPLSAALGIASPSKVTENFGRQIGEGFVRGMKRMEPKVQAAAIGLASSASVELSAPAIRSTAAARSTSALGVPSAASRTREQAMPPIVIEAMFDPHKVARSAGGQVLIREGTRTARQQGFR